MLNLGMLHEFSCRFCIIIEEGAEKGAPKSIFDSGIPLMDVNNSSMYSIGFSLFVIVIASMNLVVDFDFIEEGAEKGAPKYMEWYGAFGLMVTLVWLYLEILKLLAKMNSRK